MTRTIYWLTFTAWVATFVALAAPAWLQNAEIMRLATVEQRINAQTVAFQNAAPVLYLTIGLSVISLIATGLSQPKEPTKRYQITNSERLGRRLCQESADQQKLIKLKSDMSIED